MTNNCGWKVSYDKQFIADVKHWKTIVSVVIMNFFTPIANLTRKWPAKLADHFLIFVNRFR